MKTVLNQIYPGAFNNLEISASSKRTFVNMGVITGLGIIGSIFILMNKRK